jgi:hypothetical protein
MGPMDEASGKTPAVQGTPAIQGVANKLVRGLLRTPLISRTVGNRLIILHILGRKSGRRYVIPVAYKRHEGDLLIGTPYGWARNLRTGEPVEVRFKGKLRTADVVAYTSEADVTGAYELMVRDNKVFANFNKVGFEADGQPKPEDLHRAWADGARAFRLTLR